jgi:peptide/nickel transport system substrate-binding protein
VAAQSTEPTTFNPLRALDTASRNIIGLMHADLIHINRRTLETEHALARSWQVSPDGLEYTLRLRRGLRFSDGHPLDADDVTFTFRVHLDEQVHSPQRDLLIVKGKPIEVSRIGSHTVRFRLSAPYAAAERLFDSIAILPRHQLLEAYESGRLTEVWGIDATPGSIAGAGPFRLKQYSAGQRVILERNPFFWKIDRSGVRLPYLDEIVIIFVPTDDAQTIRFQAGELHVTDALSAENFLLLEKRRHSNNLQLHDAGAGFEFNFLVFNLNDSQPLPAELRRKQGWFRQLAFRRAVSAAIDREAVVRIVYRGLADPLWGHVTEGNHVWIKRDLPREKRSLERARSLLKEASFSWRDGNLLDPSGVPVEFSILVTSGRAQRVQIATLLQHDLRELGMKVSVVSLESRAMLDRVFNRLDYDAAVMALVSGDGDPNSEMNIWLSDGSLHLWNLGGAATPWEKEIDGLMRRQMFTSPASERKRLYDRVQELIAENLPVICIASPHVLVGASERLGNFQPARLRHYALWNADELYFRTGSVTK